MTERPGVGWECEWCGATLEPEDGVWTDSTTRSGDYCPEGRAVGRTGTSPHLPALRAAAPAPPEPDLAAIMEAATKDADLLAASFAKVHRFSALPTPNVAMDVWRDVAREYAVALRAAAPAHPTMAGVTVGGVPMGAEEHPPEPFHADHTFVESNACSTCGGTPDCHPFGGTR